MSDTLLDARDVVVACVTEDNAKYLGQALRLVQSIRWLGGELAKARIVVGAVERINARARRSIEALGAEVNVIPRADARNPAMNRLQIFDVLRGSAEAHFLVLDCDTIVVRDPLPLLRPGVFQAKIAPHPTVTHEVFERLFAHFGLPLPPRDCVTPYSGTPTIPYFNSGVVLLPADVAERLVPAWVRFNAALAAQPQLAAPCEVHIHQAALALAVAEGGIPFRALGSELNYQLNVAYLPPPPGHDTIEPAIVHYHHLVGGDGSLLPTPFARAQAAIDRFHARRDEEHRRALAGTPDAPSSAGAKPIVVIGMHRSGTSVVARLLHAMGCHAGEPSDLPAPDVFNPTGYWEHRKVVALDEEILGALDASWIEPQRVDLARMDVRVRDAFAQRAAALARALGARGTWMIKDPRLALVFPVWRDVLAEPICVLVWREPGAVARSLARRDGMPVAVGLALWEEYTRAMLGSTAGLPRVLVSYDALVHDPANVAAALHRELAAHGAAELRLPDEATLRATVDPELDRHGAGEDALLNGEQLALRSALRSGEAMAWRDVAPAHRDTRELLSSYGASVRERAALQRRIDDLALLLDGVFASRSWRIGFGVTRLVRRFVRGARETAIDRWRGRRS